MAVSSPLPNAPAGSVPVPLLLPAISVAATPLHCEAPCLESLLVLLVNTGGEEGRDSLSWLTSSLGGKKGGKRGVERVLNPSLVVFTPPTKKNLYIYPF